MKRCVFGCLLLLALLAAGILSTGAIVSAQEPIRRDLEAAAELAMDMDWEAAACRTDRAKAQWEKNWHFCATLADHTALEEIDSLFAQLETYVAAGDTVSFSAACRSLSRQVEAVGEAHAPHWWNLM